MKEPVDHILRPLLPWRTGPAITECGYDAGKVKTITRAQFEERMKDMGQQRAALFTCMTCADTARRHGSWDDDPRPALAREIQWESPWRRGETGHLLKDELLAIAALVAAHPDEFTELIGMNQRQREWLEKKAASAKAKSSPRPKPPGIPL